MATNSELKPCPFCGAVMQITSNRDWHRITGGHKPDCLLEDFEAMYPGSSDGMVHLVSDWNRRTSDSEAHHEQ